MNDYVFFGYAIKLCCADSISGFIPARPVTGVRDNIVEERLIFLQEKVKQIYETLAAQYDNNHNVACILGNATELTAADIISGVIAAAPVSYEREERVTETIISYFTLLWGAFSDVITSQPAAPEPKINLKNKRRRKKLP